MKIEVKLYSYHDMDLVGLYKTGKISFPETTRQILNSYANKDVYKVKVLKTNEERLAKYPKDSFRKYYHYHVLLDSKADADAIALLKRITPGYRNNFIKVVLRQYLCGVFLPEYFVDGDSRFFNEMSRRFQGDRDEREIRQTKKKTERLLSQSKRENISSKSLSKHESDGSYRERQLKTLPTKTSPYLPDISEDSDSSYAFNNLESDGQRSFSSNDDAMDKSVMSSTKEPQIKMRNVKQTPEKDTYFKSGRDDIEGLPSSIKHKEFDKTYLHSVEDKHESTNAVRNDSTKLISSSMEDESETSFDDFDDFLDGTTEQY